MRLKSFRVGFAAILVAPAMLGLALLSGCGAGDPPLEIQEQNIQGELEADANPQNPEANDARPRRGARGRVVNVD